MIQWVYLIQSRRGDPLFEDISLIEPRLTDSLQVKNYAGVELPHLFASNEKEIFYESKYNIKNISFIVILKLFMHLVFTFQTSKIRRRAPQGSNTLKRAMMT